LALVNAIDLRSQTISHTTAPAFMLGARSRPVLEPDPPLMGRETLTAPHFLSDIGPLPAFSSVRAETLRWR
jgi:hypothetical protein